ncbi:MAG TPA: DUF4913 domain-containing protein [Kineosporiaceae bacterium]|nr:DUF4913 domain-containing protein [Kineosporiaceae bacterium]
MESPDSVSPEVARLAAHVDELAAGVARLTAELQDLSAAIVPDEYPGPDEAGGGSDARSDDSVVPVYGCLEEWVTGYFLPTFRRPFGGEVRWCAAWQEHPEAVVRLQGLWSSWEALQVEPKLGIITWLTHYLDPQLIALLGRSGTFGQCTVDRHADHW